MKNFIKISNKILLACLALVGMSAGMNSCGKYETTEKYGMPFAKYKIKGQVTDKVTGKPIKGIKVANGYFGAIPAYGPPPNLPAELTAITDKNGCYFIYPDDETRSRPHLLVRDIDGEENGSYNDTVIELEDQASINIDIKLTTKNQ